MARRDMDRDPAERNERNTPDAADDLTRGGGNEEVRGIADEGSDEFEETEDLDEEEEDEGTF